MKIAVISDAHLFQTFTDNYDSVGDLKRMIQDIRSSEGPEMLFLAGDIFDYKKTESVYVRHYEGEGQMIRVRDILEQFGKPVYAIRGNHDKVEVLKGLEQTLRNFRYAGNDTKNFGEFSVCFMDSCYETGGYGTDTLNSMRDFLKDAVAKKRLWRGLSILMCHETFDPYPNAIPDDIAQILKKNFDLVLNGHMHLWSHKTYGSSHIDSLPSALPSKIVKGKYFMEVYDWNSKDSAFATRVVGSPFGYVVVDTRSVTVDLHSFTPSKKIVEIALDVTDLSLEESRNRLRTIFSEIYGRSDRDSLIVLPELKGSISFSPLYLEDIKDNFPELHVEPIRYEQVVLTTSFQTQVVSPPTLTVEQLIERMKDEIPNLVREIERKGVKIDAKALFTVLNELLGQELIEKSASVQQTKARLQLILSPVLDVLSKSLELERPDSFEDNLTSLLRMVR